MAFTKKNILVVDDEEDLTWSISRYLRKNDELFAVQCVSSGDAAVDLLHYTRFDLIISDIRMPGMTGLELLRYVSSFSPGTKVIIMTAYGSELLEEQVTQMGSPYYLEKPFELSFLRKIVYAALELSEKSIEKLFANSRIKELVALNCQTRRTSQLTLIKGVDRGTIYFSRGEIVHAECGELEGEHALFSILDWGRADSYKSKGHPTQKRTIRRNWQSLLQASMIE